MKEFIVWYSNGTDKFNKEFTLDDLISQLHYDEICDSPLLKDYKVIEICQSVGLEDISNNKIYADCSIVEFELIINPVCRTVVLNRKGVFKYDKDLCAYIIEWIDEDRILIFSTSFKHIKNIKIIDTIQENKLGLIKE